MTVREVGWVVAVLVCGCYRSHSLDGVRDGSVDSRVVDAGSTDGDPRDASPLDADDAGSAIGCETLPGADMCGCVAQYRRCDTCDVSCPAGSRCWDTTGVCRPFDLERIGARPYEASCTLSFDPRLPVHTYCFDGSACSVRTGSGSRSDPMSGPCMSPEFCRDAPLADPPLPRDSSCVDAFGAPFDGQAVPRECPDPALCGGSCGRCEPTESGFASCVGRGTDRPFGVCTSGFAPRCTGAPGSVGRDQQCLLVEGADLGWVVPTEACEALRRSQSGVRCVDERGREG